MENVNFGGRRPNTFEFYSDAVLVCTNIQSHMDTQPEGDTYDEIYHSANEERQIEQDEVSAEIIDMIVSMME